MLAAVDALQEDGVHIAAERGQVIVQRRSGNLLERRGEALHAVAAEREGVGPAAVQRNDGRARLIMDVLRLVQHPGKGLAVGCVQPHHPQSQDSAHIPSIFPQR